MPDFPGRLNLCLLFSAAILDVLLIFYLQAEIVWWSLAPMLFTALAAIGVLRYLRARQAVLQFSDELMCRFDVGLKGIAFILICLLTLRIYNHLTMGIVLPLADNLLDGWDNAIGLSWLSYFHFVQDKTVLKNVLQFAYISFDAVCFLSFLVMAGMGLLLRVRFFCEVFLITSLIAISIGFLFPAEGAVVQHFGHLDALPGFSEVPGVFFVEHLNALRSGGPPNVNLLSVPGLVTFPSFHTAGGVLLAIGFLKTRLFWPVSLYSAAMIAATPVFGGHYFVDQIAGVVLALVVCTVVASLPRYKVMFRKPVTANIGFSDKDSISLARR
ncbi:phosphatase PAP2 family protein [Roseibium sp. FZY0029]|uniref:phosphatase PAP2 family protein n=1 Tax=Roseibium sp. FZY0029 TaxID=3116647 RepID=UPI002EB18F81|nr:phosphatase PAP2 family protein [Roseibium sp. FZY0029]